MKLQRRFRRLRRTPALRRLVRETRLSVDQLILPLFVCEGSGIRREVSSMPGVFQLSVDEASYRSACGVWVKVFRPCSCLVCQTTKDEKGTAAYDPNGAVQRAGQDDPAVNSRTWS